MATTVEATRKAAPTEAARTTSWFQDPKRRAVAAAVVAAAIALVIWLVITSGRRKEQFASRVYSQALAAADQGNLPQASADLQRVIQTYSGTDAANEAVLALNQIRMTSGQSELAAVNLSEFVARKPAPRFAAPAYGLLGQAQENAKKFAEAAAAYEQAAANAGLGFVKASYLLNAGRAYRLAGKTQDAIRAYRTVVEKYPDAPAVNEAKVRLGEVAAGQ
jgi:outer membrane protein assembly factor BamD (BamD/ComL family)